MTRAHAARVTRPARMLWSALGAAGVLLALILAPQACLASATSRPAATARDPASLLIARLEASHAELLARHRPDLEARYGTKSPAARFVPLDQATVVAHVRALQALLTEAEVLPADTRADSLRARLEREIAQSEPGGALHHDALLWLDTFEAAMLAPWQTGPAKGCDRVRRGAWQLRTLPEAVRGAAVLLRGRLVSDPTAFEARLASLESLLRHDLPRRTEACKEPRRLAEFVVADSLAAASLAEFRRLLAPAE